MAYPPYIKEKARQLRRDKQLTIDELAERLAISRTTIYYWVRDLPIPRSGSGGGWPEGAREKANRAIRAKYRRLREEAYADGLRSFGQLNTELTFRDFVCLYIAEGYRRNRNVVSLGNSDAAVVKLANRWIQRFSRNPLTYSIQYHADQDLAALREFWGDELGVDPEQIRFQRKSNSNQLKSRTWRSRHGVLTVTAHDTYFRARLQAWIDSLKEQWLDSLRTGRGAAW